MKWQFWIDRGGTFTDVVARHPDGTLSTLKMLSDNPEQYRDAAVASIRKILGLKEEELISSNDVDCVKMGTTVATNALLERKGERTVFVTTKGFCDALRIAYQNRPNLFARQIILPELLYEQVIESNERIDVHGNVVKELDLLSLTPQLKSAYENGINSIAVVFMHAWHSPQHEKLVAKLAKEIGFSQISLSHEVSPLIKYVSRGDTTVVDAYLSPILKRYVNQIAKELSGIRLLFMKSNGGLTEAQEFCGKDAILSGPAGGIIGMVRTSKLAGFNRVIGFDMGGTSTDVSHYAGEFEREYETQIAGVRLRAPIMNIHTVAAGGGSILHFDGSRLQVGPDSASANPGPACYRRGGPLTITDCNVLLGKIQPEFFPHVFGSSFDQPLDREIVVKYFDDLSAEINSITKGKITSEQLAAGFLDIAIGNMSEAIKRISVQRGYDVTDYVLTVFGGAGGQHACLIADSLGITKIFAHPLAGVLSAYGIGLADQNVMRQKTVEKVLTKTILLELKSELDKLTEDAINELKCQHVDAHAIKVISYLHLKYLGTDTSLQIRFDSFDKMLSDFEKAYKNRFSFLMSNRELVVETLSVEAVGGGELINEEELTQTNQNSPHISHNVLMYSFNIWHNTPLYLRKDLSCGCKITGPAIISEKTQTIVVEQGWEARVSNLNHLILQRILPRPQQRAIGTNVDPIMLEMFNNFFMSIAEQMGFRLQNTAYSVSIKERLDFSCAIFDENGNLIANAPHIPVHLGSMSESIKSIMKANFGRMCPGDAYVVNDPYNGGTHLPDVTVVTPVFDRSGENILFYVGSRGHHADIGGITPGSMPPNSKTVHEEGVLFTNFQLVKNGVFHEEEARKILCSGPWPSRNPNQNIADLRAQIAANNKGVEELLNMCEHFGLDVVKAYMGHVQDNAEESVRRVIPILKNGEFEYFLDNGAVIKVHILVNSETRSAIIDFTGTSSQLDNNFNAPKSITIAAVLYVFRTLVDKSIPLNAGCLHPLNIIIPPGSMLNPKYPAAVVAGNVETSMCIVNALYGALGVQAASQGTMNNFTFGNEYYQYYETIAGGTGAGIKSLEMLNNEYEGFSGSSVVQAHMTNSRLTDPEILELRFPVRLESFKIRKGSGGKGRFNGGDGSIRRIRFLEAMNAAILSNNRIHAPFGLWGGNPGAVGNNYIEHSNGKIQKLGPQAQIELQPNDIFTIETPGGGGFGQRTINN